MYSINNRNDKSYLGSYIGEKEWLLKCRINEHKKKI